MKGKCLIYKRAFDGENEIDYTDGTKPFDCEVDTSGTHPVYSWKINENLTIPIQLNVPHDETMEITHQGEEDGVEYEYLNGKFRTNGEMMQRNLMNCFGYLLVSLLIGYLIAFGIHRRR